MVSTVASQQEDPRFKSRSTCLTSRESWVWYRLGRGLSVWSLHVLPVSAWVLSGYSSFLPQSKDMQFRLIGDSKLPVGVNVSVNGCLSLYVSPAVNWRLVQGVPHPHPMLAGIGSSPPGYPAKDKPLRKWMNECLKWSVKLGLFCDIFVLNNSELLNSCSTWPPSPANALCSFQIYITLPYAFSSAHACVSACAW